MADAIQFSDHDLDIAARTLWGECRGEPLQGQIAVAFVLRNRLEWPDPWWAKASPAEPTSHTIAAVCLHPFQFSCWNPGCAELPTMRALGPDDGMYVHLRHICEQVFSGAIPFDPSRNATMYERLGTGASWARGKPIAALIGNHAFYALTPGGAEIGQ